MDAETLQAVHRYGAVLSVLATIGGVLASVVGGPLEPLVLPLGFFGPLCGFYFVGAALESNPTYRVLGEELLRGVVWYGASIFGWAFIITSAAAVPATPATVLGLPAVTALALVLLVAGVRHATGLDLQIQSEGGQLLVTITGVVVGGFVVLYATFVEGWSPLLPVLYVLATAAGLILWRRHLANGRTRVEE